MAKKLTKEFLRSEADTGIDLIIEGEKVSLRKVSGRYTFHSWDYPGEKPEKSKAYRTLQNLGFEMKPHYRGQVQGKRIWEFKALARDFEDLCQILTLNISQA